MTLPTRHEHGIDRLGPLPAFLAQDGGGVVPIVTPMGEQMWLVRDYALAREALADRRLSRAAAVRPGAPRFNDAQPAADAMMSMDGSEHARLRRILGGSFTARAAAALRPTVELLAGEHLDRLAAAGPGADLIAELAAPLPLRVLCSLLGIPAEGSDRFRDSVEVLFDISVSTPREKSRRRLELVDYMGEVIERKRAQGGEGDLFGVLLAANDEGRLTTGELITLGLTLLMAGYETTVGQIGLSVLALLSDPAAYAELRAQPELVEPVVEELLRLSPATPLSFPRVALEPLELGGVAIPAGAGVVVSLLHGNRDEAAWPEPASLCPHGRDHGHLTFGHGVHRCLGAPLARVQVQVVLEQLLRRFPGLRLAEPGPDGPPAVWKQGLSIRGLTRLRVEW